MGYIRCEVNEELGNIVCFIFGTRGCGVNGGGGVDELGGDGEWIVPRHWVALAQCHMTNRVELPCEAWCPPGQVWSGRCVRPRADWCFMFPWSWLVVTRASEALMCSLLNHVSNYNEELLQ